MKRSDELFNLIKSLTKEEKRHFKLSATHYRGPKQYMRLFDAIDAQKEYDEEALRRKFQGERFVRQLHTAKSYLYDLILGSLRVYHAGRSAESRIRGYLDTAEILHARLLHDQAWKYVAKARELAVAYDRDADLLLVMRWERQLESENYFRGLSPGGLDRMLGEARRTAARAVISWEHHMRYAKLAERYIAEGIARTEEDRAIVDTLVSSPPEDTEPDSLPFEARISRLRMLQLANLMKGEAEEALISSQELVALLEAHPDCEGEYLPQYAGALINNLVLSVRAQRYDGFEERVDRLAGLRAVDERLRMKIEEQVQSFRLWHRIHTGRFVEASEIVAELAPRLASGAWRVSPKSHMFFLYQFACIRFGVGDYRAALDDLLAIENGFSEELRHDLYCFTRMLMLLVHFELGNIALLGYAVRSLYRYLTRHGRRYRFESVLLRYLRALGDVTSRHELIESFTRLRAELEPLRHDPGEARAFDYFDFDAWLESRITGRPFADVVRSRG